jgi:hypothetical protein
MITGDLQRVYEDYPGEEPDDMERRMKIGFSMFSKLTIANLRSLGIHQLWIPDIKNRLYRQGFDVKWDDDGRNTDLVVISRKSQLKLQSQGY